jgi:hypothetical protein
MTVCLNQYIYGFCTYAGVLLRLIQTPVVQHGGKVLFLWCCRSWDRELYFLLRAYTADVSNFHSMSVIACCGTFKEENYSESGWRMSCSYRAFNLKWKKQLERPRCRLGMECELDSSGSAQYLWRYLSWIAVKFFNITLSRNTYMAMIDLYNLRVTSISLTLHPLNAVIPVIL